MASPWLIRHVARSGANARLFCFPHAGVGASTYRLWGRALPESVEVVAVQLPGRENRLQEPAVPSIVDLVQGLLPALQPELDRPFAFFGHSMGAVLATETALALQTRGGPGPAHLFVSARRPPHLPPIERPFHALPDDAFLAEVQARYGGMPPEILAEKDLLALLLPALRADIRALELHRPASSAQLACPLTVFGGTEDRLVPREHLDAWRGLTTGPFRLRLFPGGHFYLEPHRAELLADLAATMAPMSRSRSSEVPV